MAEAESTPPKKVSCSGVKGQGPCLEMVSKEGSNDPSFQAASYSAASIGVASAESRQDFMQLGDASFLNSSPSGRGSSLVQNLQPVVTNKNSEYDPSTPHIVSYGPVYRLLKPHGTHSSSRAAPSASYKPPVSTSKSVLNGQNGYKAGFSQRDAYNSVAATYFSRNKPSISSMVITSGPMITFIMPNQSDHQLVQAINKTQSSHKPGAPIKSLVTVDQPAAETSKPFEHSHGMNNQRSTSQLQVSNEGRYQSSQTVHKLVHAPKIHLASKNPSTPQSRTTEFTQLEKDYSSPDQTYKPSNVFKAAHTTYLQQIPKPVQSSQQIADFSQGVLYGSSSMAVPLSGSVYRFTRPGYGTPGSTDTSMHVPSSSAKTVQGDYIQHFYQPGLSFPKIGYGSPSSAVASGETMYDFTQSGNAYGSADNAYTSHSQPSSSSSNLFQNPYFLARQNRSPYSMFMPLRPNHNVFPTGSMQTPSKSFDTPFSQKDSVQDSEHLNQMRNQLSNGHAATSEGFQTWHHYGPVQNDDQGKRLPKPIQSHPWKPKNLFDYLSSLSLPAEQSVSSNYNQLQTGQSESVKLTGHNLIQATSSTSNAIQGYSNPASLHGSQESIGLAMPRPVSSEYVVDQTSNPSGVLVKPFSSLLISPENRSVSSENWYGPSQPDSGFAQRGSRRVLNFQKVSFTRSLQSGQGSFSNTQKK